MKPYFTAIALLLLLATPMAAQTEPVKGNVVLILSNIYAVTQTGQPAPPEVTPECYQKYGDLLGQKTLTSYEVNTVTGIMIAKSTLLGAQVTLHPLGISGIYAFMSDGVAPQLGNRGITRVIFKMTTSFTDDHISLLAALNKQYNCVIDEAFN